MFDSNNLDVTGFACREQLSLHPCGVSPAVFRLLFRTAFFGSQIFVTELFLSSGSSDVLVSVQGLTAGIGYMALTYFLPLLFGWALLPRQGKLLEILQLFTFISCVALMVFGIYSATIDLIGSPLGGTPCKQF